ncbi:hypothetical protein NPS01_26020 [Nocardioides psychrotolerans]|uniref:Uncharacterized protein n=1 Tax=Nocardioides psychrotolerans TaxID=1005945 RepID=A0A1I3LW47_9ACTN|nr:hypothetical protein [Nocardioides psychrotolerans]GEP38939.1 hypothetical protein NPS01_26020 [Nocardioides psychrotolerans]SFI88994.1 hypothetical protein SAMN05216561_114110 [Nocardioides psychrotolerans]
MELHENLYELGLSSGRGVFDDADLLRAALDDYLDESAASTGDINLLVDAVRLGAFRMMQRTIDSGAEPTRAVESAGDLLARDRGTSDVAAARWACAVLGFAVGKVGATDVRRFDRTITQPRPPAFPPAATQQPTPPAPPNQGVWGVQSPTGPPPSSPPPTSSPPTSPPASWPPAQPYAGGYPPSYPSGPTGPTTPGRSRTPWILLALASVVLIAVIGGLVAVLAGGNDDTVDSATDDPSTSAPTDPASGPTPLPTIPPNPVSGSGYAFSLPEAWTDITEEILSGGQSGATDKAIAWGQSFEGARANLIIETGFAGGETDPEVIRPTWENNMVGATGATPVDNGDTTIDGEKAVSVLISRVNENGVAIEQYGYLTIHDGDLYSIILSTQEGDQLAQDTYADIVESWTWQ